MGIVLGVVHPNAMTRDYTNQVVWITGASSGIGESLAHAFAQRGARLVLSARRVGRLEALAGALKAREVRVVPLDLAASSTLPAIAHAIQEELGHVDVMIHNAGVGQRAYARETALATDRLLMETNFLGPLALTKALLPGMLQRGQGQFVVMSSVLGLFSLPRRATYCAAKHALHGYFNALRAETAKQGISVLTVCPGRVRSEFSEAALEGDGRRHGTMDATSKAGLSPDQVAQRTLRALDRGEDEVLITKFEHLAVLAQRLSPRLTRRALAHLATRA